MDSDTIMQARRAIEALRCGVPNRDAVRQLGVFQGDITQKFTELMHEAREAVANGDESGRKIVVSGGSERANRTCWNTCATKHSNISACAATLL